MPSVQISCLCAVIGIKRIEDAKANPRNVNCRIFSCIFRRAISCDYTFSKAPRKKKRKQQPLTIVFSPRALMISVWSSPARPPAQTVFTRPPCYSCDTRSIWLNKQVISDKLQLRVLALNSFIPDYRTSPVMWQTSRFTNRAVITVMQHIQCL